MGGRAGEPCRERSHATPLTLNFGNAAVGLDSESDLVKTLGAKIYGELRFPGDPSQAIGNTLGDSTSPRTSLGFSPTNPLSWDLGDNGNVTFGLTPSAKGEVSIQKSGTLFTYTLGDDEPTKVPVPAGHAYVSITLNVSLGLCLARKFSSGDFGVSGNVSRKSSFAITFRKAFPLSANTSGAIKETFEAFTLPFAPASVSRMADGDFLDYEFEGKIAAGFGATYGVTTCLIGGRSGGEISRSFDVSGLGKMVACAKPKFNAGLSFAFEYDHDDTFRAIVSRGANSAKLMYFRSASEETKTTESMGVTFTANAEFNLPSSVPALASHLAQSAFSSAAGEAGKMAESGLEKALGKEQSPALKKYIDDVNAGIKGLLTKNNGEKVELELRQERISTDSALFCFEFDLTQAEALSTGYPKAIAGDLRGALQAAGVTLDPGAYVEHLWTVNTAASFQFFDLFKAEDVASYYQKTRLEYAGNRTFRLVFQTGVKETATVNAKDNSCEVYFTATAPASGVAVTSKDLVVTLNFTAIDHGAAAAQLTKRTLDFIGGADLRKAAAGIPEKLAGSLTVKCQFAQAAFARFTCDEYSGDRPSSLPHPLDEANYRTFLTAVQGIVPADNISRDFLRWFGSYDSWIDFNRVKIDGEGSQVTPDRRQAGNKAVNAWPDALQSIDNAERSSLQCYIYSAQSFMNLCDSLKHLASDLAGGDFDGNFARLMDALNTIISQNIPVYFIKPALAALFRAAECGVSGVKATKSGANVEIVFAADAG